MQFINIKNTINNNNLVAYKIYSNIKLFTINKK